MRPLLHVHMQGKFKLAYRVFSDEVHEVLGKIAHILQDPLSH